MAQQLLTELSIAPNTSSGYFLVDGVIRHKGRVWVGNNPLVQQHILQALYSSGLGVHSGVTTTYSRVKHLFSWPKMKSTIQKYVQQCEIY